MPSLVKVRQGRRLLDKAGVDIGVQHPIQHLVPFGQRQHIVVAQHVGHCLMKSPQSPIIDITEQVSEACKLAGRDNIVGHDLNQQDLCIPLG